MTQFLTVFFLRFNIGRRSYNVRQVVPNYLIILTFYRQSLELGIELGLLLAVCNQEIDVRWCALFMQGH